MRIRDIFVTAGSADPYLRLTDPDLNADSAMFVSDLQDGKKKIPSFLLITYCSYIYIIF
jgi:hypothetical protein